MYPDQVLNKKHHISKMVRSRFQDDISGMLSLRKMHRADRSEKRRMQYYTHARPGLCGCHRQHSQECNLYPRCGCSAVHDDPQGFPFCALMPRGIVEDRPGSDSSSRRLSTVLIRAVPTLSCPGEYGDRRVVSPLSPRTGGQPSLPAVWAMIRDLVKNVETNLRPR